MREATEAGQFYAHPAPVHGGTGATMVGGVVTTYGEYLSLPIHETAVCPKCQHTGVTLRGELADCHACGYRWRWPFAAMDLGLD